MDNLRAIEILEYTSSFDEFKGNANGIALEKGIKALETIEKIKEIIREEESYHVSTDHPNQADYDRVSADKFKRIWKVVSDAESNQN